MRPDKIQYYMNIAREVSKRGTCLRRNYGAVIVKNDCILSTGYTGAPRECDNCIDIGTCLREELKIPSGERYDLCRSVHAEMNAIISASREDMIGSSLYVLGTTPDGGDAIGIPCYLCRRFIINAGIEHIHFVSSVTKELSYVNREDLIQMNRDDYMNLK